MFCKFKSVVVFLNNNEYKQKNKTKNSEVLSHSAVIYVNCLDLDSQMYIKSSNLACCRFLTVLGHVSFHADLRERRLCLFLRIEKVKDLEEKASPSVINVKSSCIHEVNRLSCLP